MPIDDTPTRKQWTIGLIEPHEYTETGQLLVSAFRDTYAVKMPEVVMTPRRERDLTDFLAKAEKGTTWVARSGGRVVGTVFVVRPGAQGSLAWLPGAVEVKQLATSPDFRGSGLARALMGHVEQTLVAQGCAHMCLHVRRGAQGVARFYEALGFVRTPGADVDWLPEVFLEAYLRSLTHA